MQASHWFCLMAQPLPCCSVTAVSLPPTFRPTSAPTSIGHLLRREQLPCCWQLEGGGGGEEGAKAEDTEEKFEMLVEANDIQLERVVCHFTWCIDRVRGFK